MKGSKVLSVEIEYGTITFKKNRKIVTIPKKIYFKGTLPVLNRNLSALPICFGLRDAKK